MRMKQLNRERFVLPAILAWVAISISAGAQPPAPAGGPEMVRQPAGPVAPQQPAPRGRMPHLSTPRVLGSAPQVTPETTARFNQYIERVIDPDNTLDLIQDRHRLVLLKQVPRRIQIADEKVATYGLVTERQISLVGLRTGTTVLNVWFDDVKNPNQEQILSYLLRVFPDPEARQRQEAQYKALETEINEAFPNSVVQITLVGDKLLLRGSANDVEEGTKILQIARANAPPGNDEQIPFGNVNVNVNAPLQGGNVDDGSGLANTPGLSNFLSAGGPNVINMMRVPGVQQVMLKVTVAEVNRNAARAIGANITLGKATATIAALPTGFGNAGLATLLPTGTAGGNLTLNSGTDFRLVVNALRTLNLARTLAEPTLVTLNGRPANFSAGGEFPVPVLGGFGANSSAAIPGSLQGVQFIPFGVQLSFTPFITDRNRIRLSVAANVSTRDPSQAATIGGTTVPGLQSRNFNTTLDLREGQTLAVAGLIQTNYAATSTRMPFLGDLPVVGRLFSNNNNSDGEQELMVLVSPQLVQPFETRPCLVGDDVLEPNDVDFYLFGRMQATDGQDYRSATRMDFPGLRGVRAGERRFLIGPCGRSDGR